MGFKIARSRHGGRILWAGVHEDRMLPLKGNFQTTADVIAALPKIKEQLKSLMKKKADKNAHNFSRAELHSPVTAPCQIYCQGKNYREHMKETGTLPAQQKFNLIFSKAWSSLTGARGNIIRPPGVELLDYEIELGLVMAKPLTQGVKIRENSLPEYVAALVIVNDISARDIQIPEGQFLRGKSFRTFCPVGPWLLIPDAEDFSRLSSLELHLTVNGETRQKGTVSEMIYPPHETISLLSEFTDLMPGDLVSTGTPSGVAMNRPLPASFPFSLFRKKESFIQSQKRPEIFGRYLKDGDIVRASISSGETDLGRQELQVVSH